MLRGKAENQRQVQPSNETGMLRNLISLPCGIIIFSNGTYSVDGLVLYLKLVDSSEIMASIPQLTRVESPPW